MCMYFVIRKGPIPRDTRAWKILIPIGDDAFDSPLYHSGKPYKYDTWIKARGSKLIYASQLKKLRSYKPGFHTFNTYKAALRYLEGTVAANRVIKEIKLRGTGAYGSQSADWPPSSPSFFGWTASEMLIIGPKTKAADTRAAAKRKRSGKSPLAKPRKRA